MAARFPTELFSRIFDQLSSTLRGAYLLVPKRCCQTALETSEILQANLVVKSPIQRFSEGSHKHAVRNLRGSSLRSE